MKKLVSLSVIVLSVLMGSCNNEKKTDAGGDAAQADSLQDQVIDLHDIAMPKSMKIPDLEKKLQTLLDSIGKLPAKAQEAAAPLKTRLNEALDELSYAETAMDKWMTEFKLDSAKHDMQQRIQYLTEEKLKVSKVKDAVLNSMEKADSLLKARF
jgi:TolA-binding protein